MITRLLPRLGRPARFLVGTPKRVGLLGVLVVMFASAVGAIAYFTAAGSGVAAASVGSMDVPSITTATPGAGTVALTWSTVTGPSTGPVTYSVSRDGGNAAGDCPSASPASTTSCTDSGLSAGSHSYTVTAHWRSWTSTSGTTNVNLASGATTKLVFTTSPQTAQVTHLTGTITVQRQDSASNPTTSGSITVTLSTSSGAGVFRDTGDTTTITSVQIPDGSSSASFKYRDANAGAPVITASSGSLTQAQQTETVTKGDQAITFGTLAGKRFDEGPITLSATASSGLTVAFTSATTSVCTVSGTTVTFVTVGTCTINADQAGNANWNAAAQVQQSFTISKGNQTITFTALADKRFDQGPLTLSATASSSLAVAFTSATTGVCTVSGTTITFVTVGTCTINADQAGNANWNAASQVQQSFTISKGNQTITFGTVANKTFDQSSVTVNATASSALTVTFTSATTGVCTVSGSTVTFVTVGTCTINADQAGNTNWNAASQVQQSFTISKGNQTITFTALADKRFDQGPLTLSATASSALTVTFTSATTGVCTVSGSTITFVTVGTCTINADQAGNTNWNAAPQVQQSFTISKGNQTITFGTLANTTFDQSSVSVNATASSALTVAFSSATTGVCTVSGTTVTFVTVGTCTINADQAGNTNWNAASQVQQSFTISKGNQTITFAALSAKRFDQGPITLSATASSGLTVAFTSATTGVCTVSGTTATFVTVGTCTINANQAGDTNWNAATQVQRSFAITKGTQTITFGTISTKTFDLSPLAISATASSGLTVAFTSATTSVCTVSGTTVTFVTVGTCTINANQAGNTNWNAASQVQQSFTISQGNQTISFTSSAPGSAVVGGATYTPTATATSGLTVTFTSATTSVCTVSGGTVTFVGAGTCTINANQAGNTNWNAAPQVQQSFSVSGALTILSVVRDGGNKKVHFTGAGALASTTITVTICAVNSFPCALPVTTSVVSSPAGGSWTSAQTGTNLAPSQTYYAQAVQGPRTSAVFTFSTTGL